ncbi:uncharacterized protein LOC123519625 isoform X2 [Portunus trituberculatus]|uniref:uncharacterized protein LOC123519625 isoform X2 n=1 Tax=Portunus trituberculatus TaxID=210409 RepID=UPI001E1CDEE6|nr:uncharacterized protein LOC123519625 isoform X2 [Portunus trituberculatus]
MQDGEDLMFLASLFSQAYCCRLRAEQNRLEKVSNNLVKGVSNLLETIEGNSPWEATWRWCKDTNRATLSDLLAKATAANCPVTAAFLQKAGAWSFFSGTSGSSALHAALEAGHQGMAELLIRELGGCPYVLDTYGRLPIDLMTDEERRKLEERLFEEEREKLKDLVLRQKAYREKEAVRRAIYVQKVLFRSYKKNKNRNLSDINGRTTLLLASRKGLLQLTHMLLQVGRLPVDKVLDNICGTTALHEAASHGQDGCVSLLLSVGADSQQRDTYGQTPRLLAAMFGNTSTFDLLAYQERQDSPCRAGTTATQVQQNFKLYHNMYFKYSHNLIKPFDRHCPENVIKKILKAIDVEKLQQEAVDFSKGEALEVKEAVMEELNTIIKKVSSANPIYRGELKLTGSSQDGSKLYAPDEFDVNIVIKVNDVKVKLVALHPPSYIDEMVEVWRRGKTIMSLEEIDDITLYRAFDIEE